MRIRLINISRACEILRQFSFLVDDIYEALLDLVEGKAQPPVKEGTKAMRAAAVRHWRAGGRISVKEASTVKIIRG